MHIDSLQRIMLTIAQTRGDDPVPWMMVAGLAEQPGLGLARNWLIPPRLRIRASGSYLVTTIPILNTRCEQGVREL
jgi:hypothetical protein